MKNWLKCVLSIAAVLLHPTAGCEAGIAAQGDSHSPVAVIPSEGEQRLFVACGGSKTIVRFDATTRKVHEWITLPQQPTGLALSPDHRWLYVTGGAIESKVFIVEAATGKIHAAIQAGHTATAPVVSLDGKTLYVCNHFNNNLSVIDLVTEKETARIAVAREPVAADITRDGKFLLVANHLHNTRADTGFAAAVISVVDTAAGEVTKELQLPNGSGSVKALRVSPDGKYAVVSHVLARFHRTASSLRRGWMNVNVLTIIDLARMEVYNTALLDDLDSGAANPWGVAWTADSSKVVVTHAGTHEISMVDFPFVLDQLPNLALAHRQEGGGIDALLEKIEAADYIPFLSGSHPRIKLPSSDLGPRAVAVLGHTAYTANYFSDTLSAIDLAAAAPRAEPIRLNTNRPAGDMGKSSSPLVNMPLVRKGEFYFHDATICFQGWQSCSTCHPGDARADGLNWDLLNDGIDNPKNTKSLLLAHQTSPAMWLGVRETAEKAVRAGIRQILFSEQPEEVALAIDAYLKSLRPVPSPHLVHGQLSKSAENGKKIFARLGCAVCHAPPLFTDRQSHEVGTRGPFDKPADEFVTPTLIELWRTAPYLHDGSAATVRDVITSRNRQKQHGDASHLSKQELDDLCEYVLSL